MAENKVNLADFIQESFGSNAKYVEGLLERYQTDPKLVDESWQEYFGELLNGGAAPQTAQDGQPAPAKAAQPAIEAPAAPKPAAVPIAPDTQTKPITGPAKKIVENMEQSLTVPTATSFRNIPVKVLEENRRIINEHLAAQGRGKVSFTHIIAWAIVQAVKVYPHLNVGFGMVDGVPSRLEHDAVNLGIAIDIEKKDGSRSLLVPNIKGGQDEFCGLLCRLQSAGPEGPRGQARDRGFSGDNDQSH